MASIELKNITKFYGNVQVIQEFSGVFNDREFITLLGPSGCGKTTMLRMIAGFEKPTNGEIKIGGKIVSAPDVFVPPNLRGIGMVFQSYAVWPHMNVFDNVAYPLKIQKVRKDEIKERVEKILDAVHLSPYSERMPNELSGGQQQRVALGRALIGNSGVLLLDEPLSNLDAKLREAMRFEIKEIQQRFGITVVYVTHDQTEAMAMSDRVIVFNQGIVQQADTPMNIYKNPANEFVADFVGKINFIKGFANEDSIELDGGQRINNNSFKRGEVTVAVRPENITLNNDSVQRQAAGMLKGKILRSYYLGETCDCRVDISGTLLRVEMPGHSYGEFEDGSDVFLNFNEYLVF